MRALFLAALPAVLVGCASIPEGATFLERVLAHTRAACGFVPAASVVVAFQNNPRVTSATEAAAAICRTVEAGRPVSGVVVR